MSALAALAVVASLLPGPPTSDERRTAAVLECDGPVYRTEAVEGDEGGGSTPREALTAIYRASGRPLPVHGYDVLRRTRDTVLFAYRNDDGIRAAVRVERNVTPPADEGRPTYHRWHWTAYATCDPAEFAPGADDEIGIRVVRHAGGTRLPARLVHLRPENPHCQPDAWTLMLGLAPTYVRDPQHTLESESLVPYDADATLPATAVDTGLRILGLALYADPDPSAIYAVGPDHVERWPARVPDPAPRPCA